MTTTFKINVEDPSAVRSTDTSVRITLPRGEYLTIEDAALISHSVGAHLVEEQSSLKDKVNRRWSGDSWTVRRVEVSDADEATVEVGAAGADARAVTVLAVDPSHEYFVSDGGWVAHTSGVEMSSKNMGLKAIGARERLVSSTFSGEGLLVVEGGGTVVVKTLDEGERFTLGQARLIVYRDDVTIDFENVSGRTLARTEGPGVVVYKTHSENTNQ